jgi:hypothetical protein
METGATDREEEDGFRVVTKFVTENVLPLSPPIHLDWGNEQALKMSWR